jgi:NAD(P)H dehydrogenase (quinone)
MSKVCVVYHSGYGHTQKQAEAVAEGIASESGAECRLLPVAELESEEAPAWAELDACDAMIFGSPTYMGSASAAFKAVHGSLLEALDGAALGR